ncbi:hypothetical protein HanIR_Chr13g0661001 [Helianthus annuus]|nr:hypothetical protein HanIR_Chr13g0661001 [Helianthus annuus]
MIPLLLACLFVTRPQLPLDSSRRTWMQKQAGIFHSQHFLVENTTFSKVKSNLYFFPLSILLYIFINLIYSFHPYPSLTLYQCTTGFSLSNSSSVCNSLVKVDGVKVL